MANPLILAAAALCLIGLLAPSNQELTAFDCSKRELINASDDASELLPSCDTINASQSIWAEVVERPPPTSVFAYRCKVSYYTGSFLKPSVFHEKKLGREACIQVHKTKSIELRGQVISRLNTNGTNILYFGGGHPDDVRKIQDEDIFFESRIYNVTLSKEMGTVDFKNDIVHFGKVACDYSELSCRKDGELFWEIAPGGTGNVLYRGAVMLVKRDASPTSPEFTYALLDHQGQVIVLKTLGNQTVGEEEPTEYRTELDDVYIVPKGGPEILLGRGSGFRRFDPSHDEWSNVYSEATSFEEGNAVEVVKRMCKKEKLRAMMRYPDALMPFNLVVPLPLKGRSISRLDSNVFIIEACLKTKVHLRETERCFKDIPVRDFDNSDLFLKADTRILSDHAEVVGCSRPNSKTIIETMENLKPKISVIPPESTNHPDNKVGNNIHGGWLFIVFIVLVIIGLAAVTICILCLIARCCCSRRYSSVPLRTRNQSCKCQMNHLGFS